jgi:hypothetical protein
MGQTKPLRVLRWTGLTYQGCKEINKLSPWSADLEKLTAVHILKKFPAFVGTKGSLPCPQQPDTVTCPEPKVHYRVHNSLTLLPA